MRSAFGAFICGAERNWRVVIFAIRFGCGHINFQWFLCLLIFRLCYISQNTIFIKFSLSNCWRASVFAEMSVRCSCLVCAIYRKRQQYRVDLIAKIIFIYGFPFQPSYTHSLYHRVRLVAGAHPPHSVSFLFGFNKTNHCHFHEQTKHFGD